MHLRFGGFAVFGRRRRPVLGAFGDPRGTGKTTIARIFAKGLNCTGGPKVDFDNADPRCVEITDGRSLDVIPLPMPDPNPPAKTVSGVMPDWALLQ